MRRPTEMFLCRGPDGLDDVFAKLSHGPLAIDTETTGLKWTVDRVGSINLAAGETSAFFYQGALSAAAKFVSRQVKRDRTLVFHHAKFDLHMLRATFGLHVPYPVHDTQLMSHLLDNRGVGNRFQSNHHLKDLSARFVDLYAQEPEKQLLRAIKEAGGKGKGDWLLAPVRLFATYSALDPWYTLQLYEQFIQRMRHWPQPPGDYPSLMHLYRTEQWLTLALRDMEARGIRVNRDFLFEWANSLRHEQQWQLRRLQKRAGVGDSFNWNSPDQVRDLLYGKLGLRTDRKTDAGNASTSKNTLLQIGHPIGADIIRYRQIEKAYGTFAMGLLSASEYDGFIHASFRQNVDTGRMACSDPNLQQEDKKSGVRAAFVPSDFDRERKHRTRRIRFADYSQIEMRIAADKANEESLIEQFNTNPDFDAHTGTAQVMFGMEEPDEEFRGYGKTMNFAQLFGAGIDVVTEGLILRMKRKQAFAACRKMGYRPKSYESPHRALAQLLIDRYNLNMPAMKKQARVEEAIAKGRGFVMMFDGRHRYLDPYEAYKAFNSTIQGSAAGVGKRGLVNVYRELELGTGELELLLQVHDEIVYETEGDPRTDKRVLECLEDHGTFRVPIVAEVSGTRHNWQRKRKLTDIIRRKAA